MRRIITISMLVLVGLSLACSGQTRAQKGYIKSIIPELEKAFATEGFETEVTVSKRGKVYDARVDFKGLVTENEEWEKASPEKKLAWFARVATEIMGFTFGGLEETGFITFETIYIGYAGQVWSVPIEFADYISSHALSRSKSEAQREKEVMEKLELVE
jgi:hypothetical protein